MGAHLLMGGQTGVCRIDLLGHGSLRWWGFCWLGLLLNLDDQGRCSRLGWQFTQDVENELHFVGVKIQIHAALQGSGVLAGLTGGFFCASIMA